MSRGGGGRDRFHSEYSPRVDEKERRSGWGIAPPSRHLWVGKLSQHVTQNMLSEQFLRFGDLHHISYIPGRSFAFVNFRKEEDAIIALRGLQGFSVAGMPLRIEFAKGAGDESVMKLLLKAHADVNEKDADGNSALHWCLRAGAISQDPRLAWLLIKHGAKVSQCNRLGLTPFHLTAAKDNFRALQILLL